MRSMIRSVTVASLLVLGFATVGYAQTSSYTPTSDVSGTVQRVDVSSGTVYFTDGRAVRLAPGTRLYAGGRQIALADVQPGWLFVSSGAATTPGTVLVQPAAPSSLTGAPASSSATSATGAPAMTLTAPRVDATGIVANVDSATGTITLQDGRVLGMAPGTTVWQPVPSGSIVPGASVFVRNAQPLDFHPSSALPSATLSQGTHPYRMGTVSSVDSSNARVVLSDGTVVHLRPGSQLMFNGQSLTISDLRPGDEVVVMPATSTGSAVNVAPTGPSVSALPRQALGTIEGQYLYVVRRPQAP